MARIGWKEGVTGVLLMMVLAGCQVVLEDGVVVLKPPETTAATGGNRIEGLPTVMTPGRVNLPPVPKVPSVVEYDATSNSYVVEYVDNPMVHWLPTVNNPVQPPNVSEAPQSTPRPIETPIPERPSTRAVSEVPVTPNSNNLIISVGSGLTPVSFDKDAMEAVLKIYGIDGLTVNLGSGANLGKIGAYGPHGSASVRSQASADMFLGIEPGPEGSISIYEDYWGLPRGYFANWREVEEFLIAHELAHLINNLLGQDEPIGREQFDEARQNTVHSRAYLNNEAEASAIAKDMFEKGYRFLR